MTRATLARIAGFQIAWSTVLLVEYRHDALAIVLGGISITSALAVIAFYFVSRRRISQQ